VVGEGATAAQADIGDFILRATGPGDWGRRVWFALRPDPTGFRIRAAYFGAGQEAYDPWDPANDGKLPRPQFQEEHDDLVADEGSNDYFERRLAQVDPGVLFTLSRKPDVKPGTRPAAYAGPLKNRGDAGQPLAPADFVGTPTAARPEAQGLAALEAHEYREVSLVYAPDADLATQQNVIAHCERQKFRFAVIDAPRGVRDPTTLDPRATIADSSYTAFYYPWLWVTDPTGQKRLVPPGGRVLGVYARNDIERGVAKAPANEVVRGVLDVEFPVTDHVQDAINPLAVNTIREFPGRGIRVWGARTLTSNALWKYVSVRRLFIYLEHSIYLGTQWVVFEPNDEPLWAQVRDTIRLFLRRVWLDGALMGSKEEQAFFVTCDRTTMTQDDIDNGRLICVIGVAPIRPAEFVIFRISQIAARSQC
jgi:phage tail sheath protein FI